MLQNDKLSCKIIDYIPSTKKFDVEVIGLKKRGYIIASNYNDISVLKEAYNKKTRILLYFDRYEGGVALFSCREIIANSEKNNNVVINALFSETDINFNTSLFDGLYSSIGPIIDTEEKYTLAKQLLSVNKQLKIRKGLAIDFFKISNNVFQQKFWQEGILPFFSNYSIRKLWFEAGDDEKNLILQKLGITHLPQNNIKIESVFDNIGEKVIKHILSAKSSIKIAMAWFTNFDIFRVIKHKLENSDVKITLVTNNDLINNGGYCLDLNELICVGLKIYLYEYPDMLHHKFCIIDDEIVMTGSYNWTFFSEAVNRENMLIIKNDRKLIEDFIKEFEYITSERNPIDAMPDSVPERPEYDRSSFKQYISEELIIRTKKRIGDARENISRARALSPVYASLKQAMDDLNITLDNTNVSIQVLESVAASSAVAERNEQILSHQQQLEDLNIQKNDILSKQQTISQRQSEVQMQVRQIVENNYLTNEERAKLQKGFRSQEVQLKKQEEQLNSTLNEVVHKSMGLEKAVKQAQDEISIIQNTSLIETKGGRGSLKINLKWNTIDDLDLHVFDPSGNEIYYSQKEHICDGVKGQLDVDANASFPYTQTPQENVFWEEDKNAPLGRYKVQVVLYNKRSDNNSIPFTVTVYPDKGETKTFIGNIEVVKSRKDIVIFEYSENGISYM